MTANIKNFKEFRNEIFAKLGIDMTNARNTKEYRETILNSLGVEYDSEDVAYFAKWREKVLASVDEGGGGGGGGSSDFSTAEVTFVSTAMSYAVALAAVDPEVNAMFLSSEDVFVYDDSPLTVTVPLYKGKAIISLDSFNDVNTENEPTTSGGVTIDYENLAVVITGDGSFTAAGLSDGGGGGDDPIVF